MLLQTSLFLIYSGYLGRKDSGDLDLSGFYEKTIFTKIPTYLDNSFRAIFRSALNLDKSDIVEGYDVSPIGTTIISIQNRMHCCGYFNACDYCSIQGEENVFTKELSSSFLNVNKVVRKCEDVDNRCKNICPAGPVSSHQNEQKSSFQTGCKEAFQNSFKNKQLLFESIIMSWLILQFLVSFFAIFLCCVNRKIYKDKQEFKDNHIRYQNEEYAYNYKTGAALRPDNSYSHNNQNSQNINFNDDSIDQNTAQYQSYKKVMPSSSSYLDTTLTRNMNYNRNNSNNNFINGPNLDVINSEISTTNRDHQILNYTKEPTALNHLDEFHEKKNFQIEDLTNYHHNLVAASSSEAQTVESGNSNVPVANPRKLSNR